MPVTILVSAVQAIECDSSCWVDPKDVIAVVPVVSLDVLPAPKTCRTARMVEVTGNGRRTFINLDCIARVSTSSVDGAIVAFTDGKTLGIDQASANKVLAELKVA